MKRACASVLRWFDASVPSQPARRPESQAQNEWLRLLPLLAMHLMCLVVIWTGWSPIAVAEWGKCRKANQPTTNLNNRK